MNLLNDNTTGNNLEKLCEQALAGQKRAIARLITLAENDLRQRQQILSRLYAHTGSAYVLGITGPPGAGKSSLTDKLAKLLLSQSPAGERLTVGIIAVDPSSPFSGGAILGDRIRMNDLCLEPQVFIRSLGSRGALGGLSQAVDSAVQILDACGCQTIIIETVGVGQAETEIMQLADTTLVVSVPGLGDDIQMIKAGILEIGDILVVNKADKPGAEQLAGMLIAKQGLAPPRQIGWQPPVLLTTAAVREGSGIAELWQAIQRHRDFLQQNSNGNGWDGKRRQRVSRIIESMLEAVLHEELNRRLADWQRTDWQQTAASPAASFNPYVQAERYLNNLMLKLAE